MSDKIQCEAHGERSKAFVCSHLCDGHGLGFNSDEPTAECPYPDAWCDDCEIIRARHDGWNKESEELCEIKLVCSFCYEQMRAKNTRTGESLDELQKLRWKCATCSEWHSGIADSGYSSPSPWDAEYEGKEGCYLDEDWCAIENEYFFVRGILHIPIRGTDKTFGFGVWGSLSEENNEQLVEMDENPEKVNLPPMFSWLSNNLPGYPDTMNLKMSCIAQEVGKRPFFELDPDQDHPLVMQYRNGITPSEVKQYMIEHMGVRFEG
jgi:hypothetical protein